MIVKLCAAILLIFAFLSVGGNWVVPMNPHSQDLTQSISLPSRENLLGTDSLGRDILSRVIEGTSSAVSGPLIIAVGSFFIGNILGLISGYYGGRIDNLIMRWVDLMWSIPNLLVLILVAGTTGAGYWVSVFLLLFLSTPFDTRVVRGAALEQVSRPYVEATKTIGLSDFRIMLKHVWPNVAPIAVANAFLVFAAALVSLSGLSFLGLGAPPGTPNWGLMVAENQGLLLANPAATLVPAALIALLALAMTSVGDWIDDALRGEGNKS
ncbi:ABC transporter permease [Nesterenkonia muleiensis]|uniref:ABC transporter permease n=1 Tax=Nesterenkonia muleiensis TaxID=2282648 RepID=UPI0013004B98|nr:ABC transporter permease [Nesterenkonia muleiensis]